jgi:1,2-diacylglycerol 3-beta-galactosyltransferase
VDKCFVPSDVLNEKAQSRGLNPSQIIQYGLPIRKGFWSSKPENSPETEKPRFMKLFGRGDVTPEPSSQKDSLRSELGLDHDLPAVLVVGGGDGMGGIVEIAGKLGNSLGESSDSPAYQMVVVCGSNEEAKHNLASQTWGPGVKVMVQGFVNNMDEWMNASDALVTKAGPGTIAEASICGLPCMLFAYL